MVDDTASASLLRNVKSKVVLNTCCRLLFEYIEWSHIHHAVLQKGRHEIGLNRFPELFLSKIGTFKNLQSGGHQQLIVKSHPVF